MARATVSSNGDEIARLLDQLVDSLAFDHAGGEADVAEELVDLVVVGIADRSARGEDPDGTPWDANEPRYAAYKEKRYGVDRPGELGGQMLSHESLRGKVTVTADEVVMAYGTGETPRDASRSGVALKEWETRATDREKAEYFTDSGRRFYELDDELSGEVQDLLGEHLGRSIEAGGWI